MIESGQYNGFDGMWVVAVSARVVQSGGLRGGR